MPIRVLIADDHSVVRQGLRAFLEGDRGIELVGEARDGVEAVKMAQRLRPDVILMDLLMPRSWTASPRPLRSGASAPRRKCSR